MFSVIMPVVLTLMALVASALTASRASPLAELQADARFGGTVAAVGDMKGDGRFAVVVSAPDADQGESACHAGRAYVCEGASGGLVRVLVSPNPQDGGAFASSMACARDQDGDGCGDVVIGTRGEPSAEGFHCGGRAYVISCRTGATILSLTSPNAREDGWFGASVACAGDLNGDGHPDLIVGADGEAQGLSPPGAGRAYAFCGATGAVIMTLRSPREELAGGFGCTVVGVGDVDSDGCPDMAVGSCEGVDDGVPSAGRVYIYSGRSGELLHTVRSPREQPFGWFGASLASPEDLDGDGMPDLVVGAYGEDAEGLRSAGRIYVISASDGRLIRTMASPHPARFGRFGTSLAACTDVNMDNRNDILVGARGESINDLAARCGRAYLFDGATAAPIAELWSPLPLPEGAFGCSVALVRGGRPSDEARAVVGAEFERGQGMAYLYKVNALAARQPTSRESVVELAAELPGVLDEGGSK